jgi:ribonuclease VapC
MIAIDTSAIVAIIFNEPERPLFRQIIRHAGGVLISSVSVLEARLVTSGRRGQRGVALANSLLRLPVFGIVPPGAAELEAAYTAFVTYGKGSGHPANLNFGDPFSYALAKVRGIPLLFKGDDFSHTDLRSAAAPPPV